MNNFSTFRQLDIDTLPCYLRKKIIDIEKTTGEDLTILDITCYEGFYTYYAWIKGNVVPFKGSGTSQDPEIALNRALSELYQSYAMYSNEEYKKDLLSVKNFKAIPPYLAILKCHYPNDDYELVSFKTMKNQFRSCTELLENIKNLLISQRLSAYCMY